MDKQSGDVEGDHKKYFNLLQFLKLFLDLLKVYQRHIFAVVTSQEIFIKDAEAFIDRPMLDRTDNIPHLINMKVFEKVKCKSPTIAAPFTKVILECSKRSGSH